jgi:hypothetical protein
MPLDPTATLPPPRGYRRGTVLVLDRLTRTFAPKILRLFHGTIRGSEPYPKSEARTDKDNVDKYSTR